MTGFRELSENEEKPLVWLVQKATDSTQESLLMFNDRNKNWIQRRESKSVIHM